MLFYIGTIRNFRYKTAVMEKFLINRQFHIGTVCKCPTNKRRLYPLLFLLIFQAHFSPAQNITTIAGHSSFTGDTAPVLAGYIHPISLATDPLGNIYIGDDNCKIKKVDFSIDLMSTIVGQLGCGFSGDGGRVELASIKYPTSLALDLLGNIYFSDEGNSRIRMISTAGIINTIGGNGTTTYSGDGGPATNAGFWPRCVALDKHGNIFIADFGNNRIRKISAGVITTIAGGAIAGYSGDGGPSSSAKLDHPNVISVDKIGNIIFFDQGNKKLRKIDTSGIITLMNDSVTADAMAMDSAGNFFLHLVI